MHRLFGRAKETSTATESPVDVSAHVKEMEGKSADIGAKIAAIDAELLAIKAQMAKSKMPSQQATLKQKALGLLRKKNMYAKQRDTISGGAFNLEQIGMTMDSIKLAKQTMDVTKSALKSMKTEFAEVDVLKMESLADDMSDFIADTDEINELLSRPYDTYNDVDEADLDAQLAGLEDELGTDVSLSEPGVAEPAGMPAYIPATTPTVPAYIPNLPAPGSAPLPGRAEAVPLATGAPVTFK